MNSTIQKQTIELYLNYLRGIAILCVILLHALTYYLHDASFYGSNSWYLFLVFNSMGRVGVPLFLMISGYLHLQSDLANDILEFYKKRIPPIVVPLLIWNILYFLFKSILGEVDFSLNLLLEELLEMGTYYHLWYLYTMLGIYLVTPFFKKIVCNSTTMELWIFLILIAFTGTLRPFLNVNFPIHIFFFDSLFNGYLTFYVMGYVLGTRKASRKTTYLFMALALCFTLHNAIYCHIHSSLEKIMMPFNGGYALHHLVNAVALFSFASYLCSKFPERKGSFFSNFLAKYSFSVYLLHAAVMELLRLYFLPTFSPIGCVLYLFTTTTFLSYLMAFTYHQVKTHFPPKNKK